MSANDLRLFLALPKMLQRKASFYMFQPLCVINDCIYLCHSDIGALFLTTRLIRAFHFDAQEELIFLLIARCWNNYLVLNTQVRH